MKKPKNDKHTYVDTMNRLIKPVKKPGYQQHIVFDIDDRPLSNEDFIERQRQLFYDEL
jgi:hypothetical protein